MTFFPQVASLMINLPGSRGPQELSKSTLVKYNPTGHMIAVAAGDGGKEIVIYNTLFHKQVSGKSKEGSSCPLGN